MKDRRLRWYQSEYLLGVEEGTLRTRSCSDPKLGKELRWCKEEGGSLSGGAEGEKVREALVRSPARSLESPFSSLPSDPRPAFFPFNAAAAGLLVRSV